MKRIFFIFSLLLCLLSVPVTGFAAETDEEQVKYEDATADNMKEMLKGSIALDKISAENKESLLNWLEAENKPEEAKKLVDKIQKLQEEYNAIDERDSQILGTAGAEEAQAAEPKPGEKVCPKCGAICAETAKFCRKCGQNLQA